MSPVSEITESESDASRPKNWQARRTRARGFVLQSLYQSSLSGSPVHELMAQMESRFDMSRADVPYYRRLLRAVMSQSADLDACFTPQLERALAGLDPISLNILRIGTYELQHHWDMPYKVVLNEAVNLAKKYGPEQSFGFINGVLDKVAQQAREVEYQAAAQLVDG